MSALVSDMQPDDPMTWVKLPDDALEDPQIAALTSDELLDYLKALAWSNRWARDGRVPRRIAGDSADVWIEVGMATDADPDVQLLWLLQYQPTAEEIAQRRRADAERQARQRRHRAGDHALCDPTACRVLMSRRDSSRDSRHESAHPVPSRPEPTRPVEGGEGEESRDTAGALAPLAAKRKCWACAEPLKAADAVNHPVMGLVHAYHLDTDSQVETVEGRYLEAVGE